MATSDDYHNKHNIAKEHYYSVSRKQWDVVIEFNNGDELKYSLKKDKKNEHITIPIILRERVTEYERRKKIMKLKEKI